MLHCLRFYCCSVGIKAFAIWTHVQKHLAKFQIIKCISCEIINLKKKKKLLSTRFWEEAKQTFLSGHVYVWEADSSSDVTTKSPFLPDEFEAAKLINLFFRQVLNDK